jgi:predicted nucleic acid-binding protein
MKLTHLFDTNILIVHMHQGDPPISAWIERVINGRIIAGVSVLTVYELHKGAIDDQHLGDAEKLLARFQIFPLTDPIASRAAAFYRSLPKNQRDEKHQIDLLIAATAEYYGLTILTTNLKHFNLLRLQKARLEEVKIVPKNNLT